MPARRAALRRVLRLSLIFLGLVALFTAGLTAVYTLPCEPVIANAATSGRQMRTEGIFPIILFGDPAYQLDNYTDALMMDTAIPEASASAFRAAMAAEHGNVRLPSRRFDPIEALLRTVNGHRTRATPYAHYWHGYQVLLRPTLLVTDLTGIRRANIILLAALATILFLRLRAQIGWTAAAAFAISLAATGYAIVPLSMQYSNMTYLMFGAMLVVLAGLRAGWLERYGVELFLVVGMLTAFFDLLTTPFLTLGMPMAVALIARSRAADVSFRAQVSFALRVSAAWAVGFLGSWAAKTVIASEALHRAVWQDALDQVLLRTGVSEGGEGVGAALALNVSRLFPCADLPTTTASRLVVYAALLVVAAAVAVVVVRYRRSWAEIGRAAHVLLVLPLPYLWLAVTSNHARMHYYFTYRTQLAAVFAVAFLLLSSVDFARIRGGLLYWRRRAAGAAAL